MPNSSNKSFTFKTYPVSADAFSIQEIGKPYTAIIGGGYENGLKVLETIGAVFLALDRKEKKRFHDSVICFANHILLNPDELRKFALLDLFEGVWAFTERPPDEKIH